MKIIENENKNFVIFSDLEVGEIFKHSNSFYMKIKAFDTLNDDDCVEIVQAVSLADGNLHNFFANDTVEWLDKARLILR